MNGHRHVTLVGGPADLSRVSVPEGAAVWFVMEAPEFLYRMRPEDHPTEPIKCRKHAYHIIPVGYGRGRVWIGVHEEALR